MTEAATTLGVITPVVAGTHDIESVRALVAEGVVDSVWVRDLPVVAADDVDAGPGSDPWWHLGRLLGAGIHPAFAGTASIIAGVRHPLVDARAAIGAHVDSGGRFILGVGSGGKPAMNAALGVAGRSYADFGHQWARLRLAVRGELVVGPNGEQLSMNLPPSYAPPPIYLASSDARRWQAIDGDADGWQTFLTGDRAGFDRRYAEVCRLRGAETATDVRLDARIIAAGDAPCGPEFTEPARGRVTCSADQLAGVVKDWTGPPVGRVLLRVYGADPMSAMSALRRLRDDWG